MFFTQLYICLFVKFEYMCVRAHKSRPKGMEKKKSKSENAREEHGACAPILCLATLLTPQDKRPPGRWTAISYCAGPRSRSALPAAVVCSCRVRRAGWPVRSCREPSHFHLPIEPSARPSVTKRDGRQCLSGCCTERTQ